VSSFRENLAALGEPEFRKLFIGQATSVAGTMLTMVALPFAVLEIGGSATDIGIVEAAYMLPMVLMIAAGGVWADRLERRKVMLTVDLVRAALTFTAAGLLLSDVLTVPMLLVLQIGMGICDAFFRPAYTGLVPQVVSSARLQQANALQGLVTSGSVTLGAAVGGLLVAAMGAGWAIAIDSCTFLVSALFLWRLRPVVAPSRAGEGEAAGAETPPKASFLTDLRLGWREFTSHTWLWVMVAGASIFLFGVEAPLTVLGPIVARDAYDGARTWGFLAAALGLGQIVGGVTALRWRPRRPFLVVACGSSLMAVPMAALAMEAPVGVLLGSAVLLGIFWGMFDPFWMTAMQREIPEDMISRVSSYDYLGSMAFFPLGLAIAGPVADLIGISETLWVSAAIGLGVCVFWLSWKDVRAVHDLGPRPAPPAA
jgi:MFS family permease